MFSTLSTLAGRKIKNCFPRRHSDLCWSQGGRGRAGGPQEEGRQLLCLAVVGAGMCHLGSNLGHLSPNSTYLRTFTDSTPLGSHFLKWKLCPLRHLTANRKSWLKLRYSKSCKYDNSLVHVLLLSVNGIQRILINILYPHQFPKWSTDVWYLAQAQTGGPHDLKICGDT